MRALLLLVVSGAPLLAACDRDGARDTAASLTTDPKVWDADGRALTAALPRAVGPFTPSEGAAAFATTFQTGPVFGGSCTYAEGSRNLVVRVESGNVRDRAATLAKGHANPGESFVTREVTIHGGPATLHWNEVGRTADVVFVLDRRIVVEMRVVPAKTDGEIVDLADAMDVAPLLAAPLQGVTPP